MKKTNKKIVLSLFLSILVLVGTAFLAFGTVNIASAASTNTIKIHYYSDGYVPYIYYWNSTPNNMEVSWPGKKMSADSSAAESGCYVYEFTGVDKINFLFNNGGAEGEKQTEDLTRNAGEWWYDKGKWYTKDPRGSNPPQTSGDFRDETIYFLMTTRFYNGDTNNDTFCWRDEELKNVANNDPGWRGDFKGLIEKLDYIKALGFSAIWITPVVQNASDMDYHGYHANNFSKVDPRYESSDCTYQDLIDACHARGMKVIQDIVLNHSGNWGEENIYPLFKKDNSSPEVLSTADCMKVDDPEGKLPSDYSSLIPKLQYEQGRLPALKTDAKDTEHIYHHEQTCEWEQYSVQTGSMAGDCVDLNTENPKVSEYLRDCYVNYINMGVDAFRIDTVKHISRLTFNNEFLPYFKKAGGDSFFMFGECCARYRNVWNTGMPCISTPFFTWKETEQYPWATREDREASVYKHWQDHCTVNNEPTSDNAFLNGNDYHTPDRSQSSGLDMIDFPMHWSFNNIGDAFRQALDGDKYYNDATYNVTYVDSHDYAPDGAPENQRFAGSQVTWAENLDLMFTFRGIPCIYYGSEIEFKKGENIDPLVNGNKLPYEDSGRAYFGDHIQGTVTVTGFGEYSDATGTMKDSLEYPLAQHIRRLNVLRRKIPALAKGQYSTEDVNGNIAYKKRYTDLSNGIDSFVCVSISGGATFNGIPAGTYVDAITGDTIQSSGSLTIPSVGQGNMRVYVLQNQYTSTGKIGEDGPYLK